MTNFKKIQVKFSEKSYSHYFFEDDKCLYVVNKIRDTIYLRCTSKKCDCKAKITGNIMKRTNEEQLHNHPNHQFISEFEIAFDKIKKDVENSSMPIKYLHRVALRKMSREAAGYFCYRNVRGTLQRIRHLKLPTCKTYKELNDLLDSDSSVYDMFGKIRGKQFFQGTVHNNMVFAHPELVPVLENGFELFVDATFKVTPFHTQQLLVVLSTIKNKALPVVFIVMPEKTEKAYLSVFEFLKNAVFPGNGCFFSPSAVIMDFEKGMRNAFKQVWPEAVVRGCNFHFAQALLRKARKIPSLSNKMKKKSPHFRVLKKFMRTSLIPLDLVNQGIRSLIDEVQNDKVLGKDFGDFIDYFNNVWINRYSINDWNVSNCRHRTNNVVEGYNSKIKNWINLNPSAWDFLEALLDLAIDADSKYENLKRKEKLGLNSDLSKITPKLNELLPKLRSGEIDVLNFLEELAETGRIANIE